MFTILKYALKTLRFVYGVCCGMPPLPQRTFCQIACIALNHLLRYLLNINGVEAHSKTIVQCSRMGIQVHFAHIAVWVYRSNQNVVHENKLRPNVRPVRGQFYFVCICDDEIGNTTNCLTTCKITLFIYIGDMAYTSQIAMNNFKGKFMSTYRLFLSTLFKPLCEHKHMAVSRSKYEQLQQLLIDNKGVKH